MGTAYLANIISADLASANATKCQAIGSSTTTYPSFNTGLLLATLTAHDRSNFIIEGSWKLVGVLGALRAWFNINRIGAVS